MAERTIALLVAGGTSERMGMPLPKPYLQLGEEPMICQAIRAFAEHPGIDGVRVVIRREHHGLYKRVTRDMPPILPCVVGGNMRQDSVRLGLESLTHRGPERVLVHDVARPMASEALISRVLAALDTHKAAIPALPVVDTVKRGKDGMVSETVSREQLFTVQTPQGFDFKTLYDAHQKFAGRGFTDDSALMEQAGIPVALVEGDPNNFKITSQSDIIHMQTQLLQSMETRTGFGYDVHVLKEHDVDTPATQQHIKLCGVPIPFTHYLEGHSDADVGLHALVDAILGAIAHGDIGMHFSPTDPKWQGADSQRFLLYAYELLKSRGGELVHLDVTLVCERPKVAPHRDAMREFIAQTLKITQDRVSVKATTTERLGFAGRGEGIAAQAVATVRLPRSE